MIKYLYTSTLAFNIAQFFSSLNYQLLPIILNKAGFDSRIYHFFSSYLVNRQTQYIWNLFTSSFFRADVGVDWGSALFLILLALYIASLFHIFEKRTINLLISIPVSILLFVDNNLFSASSVWSLNITNQKYSTSQDQWRSSTHLL